MIRALWPLVMGLALTLVGAGCSTAEETAGTPHQPDERSERRGSAAAWQPAEAPLMTRWADRVSPTNAHPEYPRPQMRRPDWTNLNGLWEYQLLDADAAPGADLEPDGRILVPFAVQAALSGVGQHAARVRYRRTFEVPQPWSDRRLLLHFGAVDWEATVYVNGRRVGRHRGGYDAFSYDVTEALRMGGEQEVVVDVYDPTDAGDQPRGKQVREPGGIRYTPVTGIWQTVWLEPVPETYITDLRMAPDIERGVLTLRVAAEEAEGHTVQATAYVDGRVVGQADGAASEAIEIPVPDARLWSPQDPFLYDLTVSLRDGEREVDAVESYFGMREVSVGPGPGGEPRLLLNGAFVFQLGVLDQGYWPDGLYTAPTDAALRYDLEMTKALGFNMNRKHVKVEPARWYYWADRLGVLVWQDMPSGNNTTPESRRQFEAELGRMIAQFYNHPSIVMWTVFNEGWGQYDAARMTGWVEQMDPTRPVTDASGWQHVDAGSVIDAHRYPEPPAMGPHGGKAAVASEFGGLGYPIEGHLWGGDGWGYEGVIERRDVYARRYEALMHRMWSLRDEAHMSAGVYTQVADIETEVNGLMTYDRDVLKIDARRAKSVNTGRTPYIRPADGVFADEVEVMIENWAPETVIRYTTDGADPSTASARYRQPFVLEEPAVVKAQAYRDGEPVSPVSSVSFDQVQGHAPETEVQTAPGIEYAYFEAEADGASRYQRHWPVRRMPAPGGELAPTKTGVLETITLEPAERDELFALAFDGFLNVPRTGVYRFDIHADDGIQLYVAGERVTSRSGAAPSTTRTQSRIALQEGLHPIALRYFQAYGPSALEVYVEGPGLPKQPLPERLLRRAVANQ